MRPSSSEDSSDLYFPSSHGQWETGDPESSGWDVAVLESLAGFAREHQSQALIILDGGRIIFERYFDGFTRTSTRDVASCQKSVTSVLFGYAVAQGLLTLDDPLSQYLGPGWSKATRADEERITVRHLITMTTGLNQQFELIAPPGEMWLYNTYVYQLGEAVLEVASKSSFYDYTMDALGRSIGWETAHYRGRPRFVMPDAKESQALMLSARESASFGLLALAHGRWASNDPLTTDEYWLASLSSSQPMNPGYGYLWWLNGKSAYRAPGPNPPLVPGALIPAAPTDTFAAMGALDNRIYVVPSRKVVAVRLGKLAGSRPHLAISEFDGAFWQILSRALPPATPKQ